MINSKNNNFLLIKKIQIKIIYLISYINLKSMFKIIISSYF